jgi:hypothetical protein
MSEQLLQSQNDTLTSALASLFAGDVYAGQVGSGP